MHFVRKIFVLLTVLVQFIPLVSAGVPPEGETAPAVSINSGEGLYATFQSVDSESEIFHARITNPVGIDEAIALWRGTSRARIPIADLRCQPVDWNAPWSWHLDPSTVRFAEVTIEVCDARPSYVEEHCESFGARYCPWGVELVDLRDCRYDPDCPQVPWK